MARGTLSLRIVAARIFPTESLTYERELRRLADIWVIRYIPAVCRSPAVVGEYHPLRSSAAVELGEPLGLTVARRWRVLACVASAARIRKWAEIPSCT